MKKWINQKFFCHKWNFVWQSFFIIGFMFCVLLGLFLGRHIATARVEVLTAIGGSALSASAFITFALTDSPAGDPRRLFGGYIVALLSGVGWHFVVPHICVWMHCNRAIVESAAGAISAGIAMFFMGLFDFSHPPAMGLTLGLVLDYWDDRTIAVILIGAIVLCVLKKLLQPYMRPLM